MTLFGGDDSYRPRLVFSAHACITTCDVQYRCARPQSTHKMGSNPGVRAWFIPITDWRKKKQIRMQKAIRPRGVRYLDLTTSTESIAGIIQSLRTRHFLLSTSISLKKRNGSLKVRPVNPRAPDVSRLKRRSFPLILDQVPCRQRG